jgi:hypothetical protein
MKHHYRIQLLLLIFSVITSSANASLHPKNMSSSELQLFQQTKISILDRFETTEDDADIAAAHAVDANAGGYGAMMLCGKAKGTVAFVLGAGAWVCSAMDLKTIEWKFLWVLEANLIISIRPDINARFWIEEALTPAGFIGLSIAYVGGKDYKDLSSISGNYMAFDVNAADG